MKHVAAANYLFAAGVLGERPPADAADECGPDSVKTKDAVIAYVKESFAYLHKAAKSINNDVNSVEPMKSAFGQGSGVRTGTRLGLVTGAIEHSANHYGQIVEYLRMNGIAPPAQ